jgi:hypothetical protein
MENKLLGIVVLAVTVKMLLVVGTLVAPLPIKVAAFVGVCVVCGVALYSIVRGD